MQKLLTAVLVSFVLVAVSAADELVMMSPHSDAIQDEFADAFKTYYREKTGKSVEVIWKDATGGTSTMLRQIRSQFKAQPGGIGLDIFFGGGTEPYTELKSLGLLHPYKLKPEQLEKIAATLNGVPLYDAEDYTWYSATMSGFGIIYNKPVIERMKLATPKTWGDLTKPEMYGWVGSADPRKSGSVHMSYEIMLQAYEWNRAWEIIHALGGNVRTFVDSAGATPQDVAKSDIACGLAIDFYAWRQVRETGEEYIGYVMPEDLSVVNGDAIGILKGAPNLPVAKLFIDFVMSEAGQKLWTLKPGEPGGPKEKALGRFTVMPKLYDEVKGKTVVTLNPFEWKSTFVYNPELGSARYGLVNDLVGAMVIDSHKPLRDAWKRLIDLKVADVYLPTLAALPITKEQSELLVREVTAAEAATLPCVDDAMIKQLTDKVPWRDQEYRNKCLSEWAAFARKKYEEAGGGTDSAATTADDTGKGGAGKWILLAVVIAAVVVIVMAKKKG